MDGLIGDALTPWSEADQPRLDIRDGDAVLVIEGASRKFGLLYFAALDAAFFLPVARLPPSDPFWRTVHGRRAPIWPSERYVFGAALAWFSLRAYTIDRGHVDHTFRRCRIVRAQA